MPEGDARAAIPAGEPRGVVAAVLLLGFFLPLLAGGNTLILLPAGTAFHIFLAMALLVAVLLVTRGSPPRPLPLIPSTALVSLLVWWTGALLFRPSGPRAGLELQALTTGGILHLVLLRHPLSREARLALAMGLVFGVIGTAIVAQHQYWTVFPRIAPIIRDAGYPFFASVNANFYSANCYAPFLAATALLALGLMRSRPPVWIAGVAAGAIPIILVTLLLTRSRSTVALLGAVLLIAWLCRHGRPRPRDLLAATGILLAVSAAAIYAIDLRELWGVGVRGRIVIWQGASAMIADQWWLGVGLGRFAEEFPRHQVTDYYTRYPHSLALEVLAEVGIFGAAALVVFLGASLTASFDALSRATRDDRLTSAAALAAALLVAHAQVDIDWRAPANPILLFLLLALADARPEKSR